MRNGILFFPLVILAACSAPDGGAASDWTPRIPLPADVPNAQPECQPGAEPAVVELFAERREIGPAESVTFDVHIKWNEFCGPVRVELDRLPDGVSAEPVLAMWPSPVATIVIQAADTLPDQIRRTLVRVWSPEEQLLELTVRSRSSSEPDWRSEVVGIPRTRTVWDPTLVSGDRLLFADYERTVEGEFIPYIHCIRILNGRCPDFGDGGTVTLESADLWAGLARSPDESFIVYTSRRHPSHQTTWFRLSPHGLRSGIPEIASAATETAASGVSIDGSGRILFASEPDDSPLPNALVRLKGDGSLDAGFGEGGMLITGAPTPVGMVSDGRIVTNGPFHGLVWRQENGVAIGDPVHLGGVHSAISVLSDGSVIFGHIEGDELSGTGMGTVKVIDATGNLLHRWELGPDVGAMDFALGESEPLVVAQKDAHVDGGTLRVLRLPLNGEEPILVAEHVLADAVWNAEVVSVTPIVIVGTRDFRLPDGEVPWAEAFIWQAE